MKLLDGKGALAGCTYELVGKADEDVPAYRVAALRFVLAERERELLELKGPCSNTDCRLHYAHAGPCDVG